jgi:hypothetical protein
MEMPLRQVYWRVKAVLYPKFERPSFGLTIILLIAGLIAGAVSPDVLAGDDYISTAEIAGITGGTLGTIWLGHELKGKAGNRDPVIKGPLPLDRTVIKWLGGDYHEGKTNFLDNNVASAATTAGSAVLLLAANLSYPPGEKKKDVAQDMFLFMTGSIVNKGITDISKGIFARPRPYTRFGSAPGPEDEDFHFSQASFYSGHSSSAFFATTYLNLRLRSIMRSEMSVDEYRKWRWAPPAILYGWSAFVAWSRIHAYKHYFSDVSAGALMGYLLGELFYWIGESAKEKGDEPGGSSPQIFKVTIRF